LPTEGHFPAKIDVTLWLFPLSHARPFLVSKALAPPFCTWCNPSTLLKSTNNIENMPVSGHDDITDDYVTEMLKRDAKAVSSSSLSLASLINKRCHP